METVIRLGTKDDKDAVLALYRSMYGLPGCTWDEHYPNEDVFGADVETGSLYLMIDGNGGLVAAASFFNYEDYGLKDAENLFTCAGKWVMIARVAVVRGLQGKGYAKMMLSNLINTYRANGYESVRLLVSEGNAAAIALYEKLGFAKRGRAFLYDFDWVCYELIL
jgi:ribosomal protein S18 acetylase RimI-like enzyme